MIGRRLKAGVALVAAGALLLAGCTDERDGKKEADKAAELPTSIAIHPLFVQGDSGGVGSEVITREPTDDGTFRIDFSEDEVGGMGEASRAASWNAAIVSTLLTGEPLSGRFGFEISGRIDGPSAGALKTVALVALQNGDTIDKTVTMTGTINATGTIGPVGGIPEKLKGAAEEGLTKVLVPLGQRNSTNAAGEQVDLVREGDRLGVEVVEVGDIYEAYPLLTGEKLPAPAQAGEPRLDTRSYDKTDAQVDAALARYQTANNAFNGLPLEVQTAISSTLLPDKAAAAFDRATDLQRQGLVAGAFTKAQEAAALMETLLAVGSALNPLFTQGLDGLPVMLQTMTDISPAERRFFSFLDQLSTYEPATLSDVEAVTTAYGGAFDAYSMLSFATAELQQITATYEQGAYTSLEQLFTDLTLPLLYAELAKAELTNTQAVYEVGRENGGAAIREDLDLRQVGDFFRRGADANFAAFSTSGVVAQLAESNGVSTDLVINHLAQYDANIALSVNQSVVAEAFADYIGEGKPNASYAIMGYGLSNYVRNQLLVEKYYNNAIVDEQYQVVGLQFEGALDNALDLGRAQLSAEIDHLRTHESPPVISVGQYEAGGVFRADGAPAERFDALWYYNSGFLLTRLMSYLGGFETPDADDTSTKKDPVPSEKATKPSDDTTEDDT
ncbi:hypothetical protein Cch01nite_40330 [Cellulomonas chitinilytica]|uniref:endopeptidase La n=1 Tax=Cellulomonas chitinilytica TaxID=398759 RepID=A0A919P9E1_9CELL|nr:S16 family serine protease [Cellulomonas chitinilytica]GIG23309.1 hypothetical protein Cch01nite_40330 [Cellulomonas chitinilytica]